MALVFFLARSKPKNPVPRSFFGSETKWKRLLRRLFILLSVSYYFVRYGLIPTTTVADSDLKVSGESALPVPKIKGAALKIYFSGPQFGLKIRWRPSPPPLGPLPWGLSPRSATVPYQTVTFLLQRIQST